MTFNVKKKYLFRFTLGVYDTTIVIAVNCTEDDIRRFLKREKATPEHIEQAMASIGNWDNASDINGCMMRLGGGYGALVRNMPKQDFWNCLIHELTHISQYLMRDRGLKVRGRTGFEAQAYIMGALFEHTLVGLSK